MSQRIEGQPRAGETRAGARRGLRLAAALLAGLALAPPAARAASHHEPREVLIDAVEPWSLAEGAGLRRGDRLLGWRRAASFPANPLPAQGVLDSPFELERILREEAPRGGLELIGLRGGRRRTFTLPAGAEPEAVGVRCRPGLAAEALAALAAAREAAGRVDQEGPEGAAEILRRSAEAAFASGDPEAGLWLLREGARTLDGARRFPAADAAYAAAAQAFALRSLDRQAAETLADWARSFDRRWRWDEAVARLERAERALGAATRWRLTLARILYERGEVLRHRDDYAGARRAHERALALRTDLAPDGLDQAASLFVMGRVAAESGGGDPLPLMGRAEGLVRRLHPGSLAHGFILDYEAHMRGPGAPEARERGYREALAIALRREPGGYLEARVLFHLGALFERRGETLAARDLLGRAREVLRGLPEEFLSSFLMASVLAEMGRLSVDEGDEAAGYDFAGQAVALQRRINPRSLGVVAALMTLGQAAYRLHRYSEARTVVGEAIALEEALVPDSPAIGRHLLLLAQAETLLGAFDAARRILARARFLHDAGPSDPVFQAALLGTEALVAGKSGRVEEAIALERKALRVVESLGVGEIPRIDELAVLAYWERAGGRWKEFREHACEAARLLDQLSERYGLEEAARLRLAHNFSVSFQLCAEALLHEGNPGEAFRAIESGRARVLLALLASRAPGGTEVPRPRPAERDALRAELEPLAPEAVRGALDPGTLLLEYAVGDLETLLFLVPSAADGEPGLEVLTLPWGAEALRDKVAAFRALLASPLSAPEELSAASRELFAALLGPAAPAIARAGRLLIAADGPLNDLPFAALQGSDGHFLIESKPLHATVSSTVYARLTARRRPVDRPEALRVAAFGDPVYGPSREGALAQAGDLKRNALRKGGIPLDPLPASRSEVESIRSLFPSTLAFLGAEATERQAKALGPDLDIVHFAVHAFVDSLAPQRSALVLTPPSIARDAGEDGLLEAHEVMESLRLEASLVTLSACETALGRTMGGEGVVGLARAFHFAGSRSVLASLWPVGDRPTAELMRRFYAGLRSGGSKDAALREAQLGLLRDPVTAHPSSWAGFVLLGDYR